MKLSKESRKLSKQLFQSSLTNGQLDAAKIRGLAASVIENKPRNYVAVLKSYHRLLRLEAEKHVANVESASPLTASAPLTAVVSFLKSIWAKPSPLEIAMPLLVKVEPSYPDRKLPSGELNFKLVPDQPIVGRVIDTQGKPVAGATVGVSNVMSPLNNDMDRLVARTHFLNAIDDLGQLQPHLFDCLHRLPHLIRELVHTHDAR